MKPILRLLLLYSCSLAAYTHAGSDATLAPGAKVVWDLAKAHRESTPSREQICVNGLWRWQPAATSADKVPEDGWGFFKVPGSWPGISNYMQKDSQTLQPHPSWKTLKLSELSAAWYQREITIPAAWTERRIVFSASYLNSYAAVFVDGKKAGELRFPAGETELTSLCTPGRTHTLSLHVLALPLKGVLLSYNDTASAREVKGSVARRGLCGDVFLIGMPAGPRITDVKLDTSWRKGQIVCDTALQDLQAGQSYTLKAKILENGREQTQFTSEVFKSEALKDGRLSFTHKWKPEMLWDVHTAQHTCTLELSLLNEAQQTLDAALPVRFGFREFWIEGRDFYLNGTRIFLSVVPLDNAQVGAFAATYAAARESLERLKLFGINCVYTHNYGCQPGDHLSFDEILRAADDLGMLVALSQPHFGNYDWAAADAEQHNGYARHAEFYVRLAQNHPSVVMYATSHNATGYSEDMNPDLIDGLYEQRDTWSANNVKKAVRAEQIIKRLDSSRVLYHHSSGNLGSMHTSNFYPNFAPIQELSDWFAHWATKGVKPLFLVEYGAPFSWDWAMYRGWYKGQRTFGSAKVPWEFCLAEWNAQFLGDSAFQLSELEKKNLRWESKQFRAGSLWHRWDYPGQLGATDFDEREPVFARYFADNWRAFRAWGVSANSPWEHNLLWKLRPGMERNKRQACQTDWENLQRPGLSPDFIETRYERMDLAYERSDWLPTLSVQALIRNNMPLLAYIAGKPSAFTSKDHNFTPGDTLEKQLVVINNSRRQVSCEYAWSLNLPQPLSGKSKVTLETGEQKWLPLSLALPATLPAGDYRLRVDVLFSTGDKQHDEFTLHVLARRAQPAPKAKIALFDPKGEIAAQLKAAGVRTAPIEANADLSGYELLIIGKAALTVDGPAPDIGRVRDGLKVLIFEQTPEVLEQRLGFRTAAYGLREVFKRVPDHPVLAGLQPQHLRDWRGEATTLPPRLKYETSARFNGAPAVKWCDLEVTRAWRCGCRGNVASALIEKPACGDWLPIVDGGFSLQYSQLLEYREGKGLVLFCQLDVSGRTESDPAAETLLANMLAYVCAWKPAPPRESVYVGEPAGKLHLQAAGIKVAEYTGGELRADQLLIAGPGSGKAAGAYKSELARFLKAGGRLLAVALSQEDANALLSFKVTLKPAEYINACFEPASANSPLAGVGPADVHNRDPRTIPLIAEGASSCGGVLGLSPDGSTVLCQLAPWHFNYSKNYGLKRTFRRSSSLLARLLGNLGVSPPTPLLERVSSPATPKDKRWLKGFYLDQPEEWDDPYRFFRW